MGISSVFIFVGGTGRGGILLSWVMPCALEACCNTDADFDLYRVDIALSRFVDLSMVSLIGNWVTRGSGGVVAWVHRRREPASRGDNVG